MKLIVNTIPLLSPLTGIGRYVYQVTKGLVELESEFDWEFFYGYYSKKFFIPPNVEETFFYRFKQFIKKSPLLAELAIRSRDRLARSIA